MKGAAKTTGTKVTAIDEREEKVWSIMHSHKKGSVFTGSQ